MKEDPISPPPGLKMTICNLHHKIAPLRKTLTLNKSISFSPIQKPPYYPAILRSTMSQPHALIVHVEIPSDRMEEFLKEIENNAVNARKEPGCLQFGTFLLCGIFDELWAVFVFSSRILLTSNYSLLDVLRTQENPNQFIFVEVYKSYADLEFHWTQPHFKRMAAFKASGGFLNAVRTSAEGVFVSA